MSEFPELPEMPDKADASEFGRQNEQFVRLLTQNERKIYGFILSLVPNWADADEILQETVIRLWSQCDKFEHGTDFAAWACAVAHYQVMTFRKRAGRQKIVFSQEFVDAVEAETEAARPQVDDRQWALSTCLKQLQGTSRQIIDLCYRQGLTGREAAVQLRRSAGATYKALARVRRFLHECVERQLAEEVS